MANPTWITSENVKFNGTLENAAVIKTDAGIRSLILWDDLSLQDQTILIDFVDQHGGALPLASPTSGIQVIDFDLVLLSTTTTNLSNIATATAGYSTIDVGGAKTGASTSGLSTAIGNHGAQVINFNPPVTATTVTGVTPSYGYQTAIFSVGKQGTDVTGLVNDVPATHGYSTVAFSATVPVTPGKLLGITAGSYDFDIKLDAAAVATKTITATGSDTMTTMAALIQGAIAGITVAATNNTFVITSDATGATSVVVVGAVTGEINPDLFTAISTSLSATHTFTPIAGTDIIVTTYTASITVDGTVKPISIAGSAAQTFTTLLSEINTDLGASAVATLAPAAVAGYQDVNFNVVKVGGDATGLANDTTAYTANITVDGTLKSISVVGSAAQTFTTLLSEINTDLSSAGTATIVNGNIRVTSATTGVASIVSIVNSGTYPLFASLTSYVEVHPSVIGTGSNIVITSAALSTNSSVTISIGTLFPALTDFSSLSIPVIGKTTAALTASITIDGTPHAISILPAAIPTYADVIVEINADLGGTAVASISPAATSAYQDIIFVPVKAAGDATGLANDTTAYTATIAVDGIIKPISVVGSAAQTFTTLLSEINTDLGASAIAAISGGNIRVTSATTGATSIVSIVDTGTHPLFGILTNYSAIATAVIGTSSTVLVVDGSLFHTLGIKGLNSPINGITDLIEAAKHTRSLNGTTIFERFDILYIGTKPHVPPYTPHTIKFVYWDGSVWKYLDNDVTV